MSRGIAEPKYEEQEEKYIIDIDRSEEDGKVLISLLTLCFIFEYYTKYMI